MKKSFSIFCLVAFLGLLVSSCSTESNLPKETHAKFVGVDRLMTVPMGSSYDEVVRYFGSAPYEMLSRQLDGYQIFVWKYRVVHREVTSKEYDARGGESNGNEKYVKELKDVYALFKNDRLMDLITTDGRSESPDLLLITNTIYQVTKDAQGYSVDKLEFKKSAPAANEEKPSAQPVPGNQKKSKFSFLPF